MFEQFVIEPTATIVEALTRIKVGGGHRALLVVDSVQVSGSRVVGVFSEGDAIAALLRGVDIHAPIDPFVCRSFKFLRGARADVDDVRAALNLMRTHGVSLVPIVDDGFRLVHVYTLRQILGMVVIP